MGANAFLSKGCEYSELLAAINNVHQRGFHFTNIVTRELVSEVLHKNPNIILDDPLSLREIEVLELICKQKTSTEISEILGISLRTVENHRLHIMKKIGVRNVVGLLVYAMKTGMLHIDQL